MHGSVPDITGKGIANPIAAILSVGRMLEMSLGRPDLAARVEAAVGGAIEDGIVTPDLGGTATTQELARQVLSKL